MSKGGADDVAIMRTSVPATHAFFGETKWFVPKTQGVRCLQDHCAQQSSPLSFPVLQPAPTSELFALMNPTMHPAQDNLIANLSFNLSQLKDLEYICELAANLAVNLDSPWQQRITNYRAMLQARIHELEAELK